jgi:DNA-binding NarL/FixJ family response regulator
MDSEPSEDKPPGMSRLSERERQVLALVADGLADKEIADKLGISHHTVGDHLKVIFRKLGRHSRAAAATLWTLAAAPGGDAGRPRQQVPRLSGRFL